MIYWPFDSVVSDDGEGNVTYDREFNSEKLRKILSLLYTDGVVLASNSGALKVSAGTGMGITVAAGACIIQGAMGYEADAQSLTVPDADNLPRVDSVVLRLNTNMAVRNISIVYLQGTAASSPLAPAITRNGGIFDLRLANIRVAAGATSITTANISDTRLGRDCGVATAIPQVISTAQIFDQYQAALTDFLEYADSCLDGTVAGNLQNEIDEMKDDSIEGSLAYQMAQVLEAAEAVQASVNTAINGLKISAGDELTWSGVAPIYITEAKKAFYFEIPLNRPVAAGVTGISHVSSDVRAKYENSYIYGTASTMQDFTSKKNFNGLTGTISETGSILVRCGFSTSMNAAVENGRMGLLYGSVTIKFE